MLRKVNACERFEDSQYDSEEEPRITRITRIQTTEYQWYPYDKCVDVCFFSKF